MASLKKKVCVTVFLDELFEVIEEGPPKQFHIPQTTDYPSRRHESASKTSFTRKTPSSDFNSKPRSWSENQFLQRGKLERRIKKPRCCKQNVTIVVKEELDKFELEEKNKIENEKRIVKAITEKKVEDNWSNTSMLSDNVSDNYSESSDCDEKNSKVDKCTQFENISPKNYQTKKILEASKFGKSHEVIQKIEYLGKAEVIKADDGLLDQDLSTLNIIRHCICYDKKRKSFQELYRREDEMEDSSSQTDYDSEVFSESSVSQINVDDFPDMNPDWCDTQTLSILSSTCDVKLKAFMDNNNGERILCYSLCVEHRNPMEKIAWNFQQMKFITPIEDEIFTKTEIGVADVAEYRFIARSASVRLLTCFKISRGILMDEKVTQTEDDVSDCVSFVDAEDEVLSVRESESEDVVYTVTFEEEADLSYFNGRNIRAICNLDE